MLRATPPSLPGSPAPLSVLCCDCGPITRPLSGTRWPSPDEVAQGVRRALARGSQAPQWITLSGRADPALHPRLGVVIDRVLTARDALAPSSRVAILSKGPSVDAPTLREALRRVEAGTFDAWRECVVRAAPDRLRLYPSSAVPGERLEEIARELRDALPAGIVEVC